VTLGPSSLCAEFIWDYPRKGAANHIWDLGCLQRVLSALYETLERFPDPDDTKLYQIAQVVADAVHQEWKEHLEENFKKFAIV
jgi:hypothetical protein